MIDLETLGTTPGCAIVSIGACSFDMEGIKEKFYQAVDISRLPSGTIDAGTVKWWLQQSDAARAVFTDQEATTLAIALERFAEFWDRNGGIFLWGHGAAFDAPILDAACNRAGVRSLAKFWNYRDTRTLYALADVSPAREAGTHHNALDDAVAQAVAVIESYKALGKSL